MDGRRRQWIAWDTNFNAGLGADIRETFGVTGCFVFQSFIAACKKNAVQGRMSYTNETEALMAMGLPGLTLKNEQDEPWELADLWVFLSRKKQVRRITKGRVTTVISTKWEQWQKPPRNASGNTSDGAATAGQQGARNNGPLRNGGQTPEQRDEQAKQCPQTSRSEAKNTSALGAEVLPDTTPYPDINPDPDSDICSDLDTPPARRSAVDDAMAYHQQQKTRTSLTAGEGDKLRGLLDRLEAMCKAESKTAIRNDAVAVIAQAQAQGVPLDVLEAAINELGKGSPVLPRALVPVVQRHCARRGLATPMFAAIGVAS